MKKETVLLISKEYNVKVYEQILNYKPQITLKSLVDNSITTFKVEDLICEPIKLSEKEYQLEDKHFKIITTNENIYKHYKGLYKVLVALKA